MNDHQIHLFMNRSVVLFAGFLLLSLSVVFVKERSKFKSYTEAFKFLGIGIFMVGLVLYSPLSSKRHLKENIHRTLLLKDTTHGFVDVSAIAFGYCALLLGIGMTVLVTVNRNRDNNTTLPHNKAL